MKRMMLVWTVGLGMFGLDLATEASLAPVADGSASTQRNPANSTLSLHVNDSSPTNTVGTFTGNFGGAGVAVVEFDISSLGEQDDPYQLEFTLNLAMPGFSDLSIYGKQGNGSIEFNDWMIPPGGETVAPGNSPLVIPLSSTLTLANLDLIETVGSSGPINAGDIFRTSSAQFDAYLSDAISQQWNYLTIVLASPVDYNYLYIANLEHSDYEPVTIVSVPEPSTVALLLLGAVLLASGLRPRKAT